MLKAILLAVMLIPAPAAAQGIGDIEAAIKDKNSTGKRAIIDVKSALGCSTGIGEEVVVCGRVKPKYGPDADIMEAAEPAAAPPTADRREVVTTARCGTGGNLCDSGQIPVTAVALAGAKAVLQAIRGEDWKEVFRTRPDEYQRYIDAKNRRRARARVSVGVGAGTKQ